MPPRNDWAWQFPKRLAEIRHRNMFTDVEVLVQGEIFNAHRNILAAASDFFLCMFTANMQESKLGRITISNVSARVFKVILDYIYSATSASETIIERVEQSESLLEDLLQAADMLQVVSLVKLLTNCILRKLRADNLCRFFVIGWRLNIQSICDKVANLIGGMKKGSMSKQCGFQRLDIQCLKSLFTNPHLSSDEESNCAALMSWIEHDKENRMQHIVQVVSLICSHNVAKLPSFIKNALKSIRNSGINNSSFPICKNNLWCPERSPKMAVTVDDLCGLYGERCIILEKNKELMNSYTCRYTIERVGEKFDVKPPTAMLGIRLSESPSTLMTIKDYIEILPDHRNLQIFYQDQQNSGHAIMLISTDTILTGVQQKVCSLGLFSSLPSARLIVSSAEKEVPNPRFIHVNNPERDMGRKWRWPYMLIVGGVEVDMDDAVRFISSIFRINDKCRQCSSDFSSYWESGDEKRMEKNMILKRKYPWTDIWLKEKKRQVINHFNEINK